MLAPCSTNSARVDSHWAVGEPLQREGAMVFQLLEEVLQVTHLNVCPNFRMACPPKHTGLDSLFFSSVLLTFPFLPFGFNAAVSLFGCVGWLLAEKVA